MKSAFIGCMGLLLLGALPAWGQRAQALLDFQADSIDLGRPVALRLSVRRPPQMAVIFPRDPQAFAPFDWVRTEEPSSHSLEGNALESITYWVRSFEVRPQQSLALTLGYVSSGDTTWERIESDSVLLRERVPEPLEEQQLRGSQARLPLSDPPDYSLIFVLAGLLSTLVLVLMALLRKPVQRYLRIQHNRNVWLGMRRALQQIGQEREQALQLTELNVLWKNMLDPSGKLGLRSQTSTELRPTLEAQDLSAAGREVLLRILEAGDRVLYAGSALRAEEVQQLLQQMEQLLDEYFAKREQEIRRRRA
jgi:hypothetical protein